ncbi:hypothetical protein [Sinosporangium album]|uniref:hypothetical protein n=1 Tax=Sinosporangium album TaxID=504805 RepID=UPI000B825AEF|nr:hypothetical protein [Sinosporangium album]
MNERQLAVLNRIGTSTDSVTAKNSDLANTVYALRNRGLVKTPRRDGVWRAEITEAGRFYLENGYHPDHPDRAVEMVDGSLPRATRGVTVDHGTSPQVLVKDLMERLKRDGGTLRLNNPDEQTRASYRRLIHAAKRRGLVPAGFHLRHTGRDRGDMVILLTNDSQPETNWNRVRLGTRKETSDPRMMVSLLEEERNRIRVSPGLMPRVKALLEGLSIQAERRGYKLIMSLKRTPVTFYLQKHEQRWTLTVSEVMEDVPQEPTAEERRRRSNGWSRPTEYGSVPTGRLRMELQQSGFAERTQWVDNGRTQVESKVREVIKELEHRVNAAEQARLKRERELQEMRAAEERKEAERLTMWETAMTAARECALEDRRRDTLGNALQDWFAAAELHEFCEALEKAAANMDSPEEAANLRQWVVWGQSMARQLDPTISPGGLASIRFDAEPEADDLRPYLGDWSPHGPYQEYRYQRLEPPAAAQARREPWRLGRPVRGQWWRR